MVQGEEQMYADKNLNKRLSLSNRDRFRDHSLWVSVDPLQSRIPTAASRDSSKIIHEAMVLPRANDEDPKTPRNAFGGAERARLLASSPAMDRNAKSTRDASEVERVRLFMRQTCKNAPDGELSKKHGATQKGMSVKSLYTPSSLNNTI